MGVACKNAPERAIIPPPSITAPVAKVPRSKKRLVLSCVPLLTENGTLGLLGLPVVQIVYNLGEEIATIPNLVMEVAIAWAMIWPVATVRAACANVSFFYGAFFSILEPF